MTPVVAAIDFEQGIESAWSRVAEFVPKLIGFLVILIVGYIIVKVIAKAVEAVLERVGFDKAVERGGVKKALAKSKYDASDLISKVVFYGLFLLVLQAAFGVFGANPVSELIASVIAYLPKVFVAIIIIVVASAIAAGIKELVGNALGGLSYGKTLATAASAAVLVIGVFAALNQLQIAPAIVNGLFYALLAVVVGSAIVAIGGSGIQPLRSRWENTLQRYDAEKPNLAGAGERMKQQAIDLRDEAKDQTQTQTQSNAGSSSATGRSGR